MDAAKELFGQYNWWFDDLNPNTIYAMLNRTNRFKLLDALPKNNGGIGYIEIDIEIDYLEVCIKFTDTDIIIYNIDADEDRGEKYGIGDPFTLKISDINEYLQSDISINERNIVSRWLKLYSIMSINMI